MDPALQSALARGFETALNRALNYDPGTQAALAELTGKLVKVVLHRPQLTFYCGFAPEGILLFSYREEPADTTIHGSVTAVASLLWRERHTLAGSGVEISGDVGLVHKLQQILANLEVDWEQILHEAIGKASTPAAADLLSFPITKFLRDSAAQVRRHVAVTPDWMRDYLTEELRMLPSPHEVAAFAADVDEVRAAADRLEARLRKLREQIEPRKPAQP